MYIRFVKIDCGNGRELILDFKKSVLDIINTQLKKCARSCEYNMCFCKDYVTSNEDIERKWTGSSEMHIATVLMSEKQAKVLYGNLDRFWRDFGGIIGFYIDNNIKISTDVLTLSHPSPNADSISFRLGYFYKEKCKYGSFYGLDELKCNREEVSANMFSSIMQLQLDGSNDWIDFGTFCSMIIMNLESKYTFHNRKYYGAPDSNWDLIVPDSKDSIQLQLFSAIIHDTM